jgi:hypothetical protein
MISKVITIGKSGLTLASSLVIKPMAVLLRLPLFLDHKRGSESYRSDELAAENLEAALERLYKRYGLTKEHFYLVQASEIRDDDPASTFTECSPSRYSVRLRLRGGKGGFGSQLRAQGNKMSSKRRAGNYEACRDLSTGQRLRSSKHAKLIEDYVAKEPERLSQREQEIREKMLKHLEAPGRKVMFGDAQYLRESRKLVDGTYDAVMQAFVKAGNFDSDDESEEDETEGTEDESSDDLRDDCRKENGSGDECQEKNNSDDCREEDNSGDECETSTHGSNDEKAPLK